MKTLIGTIKKFFQQRENIVSILLSLISILLLASLFINNYNILKFFILIIFILALSGLILFLVFTLQPKREQKFAIFSLVENLLDNFQEGVVIYNEEFRIIFVNKSFSRLVNLKKEELINLIVKSEMIENKSYQILANIFFPFLQGENLKIINQNPETIEVKFSQPEESYFLISYVDIYLDQKLKLRVVLDKTQDVIESQKRLEFIQMISHNLFTPLSEIRWNLEALDLEKISDENKDFIESSLKIIKSTIFLAESTLNLLKTEFGKIEFKVEEIDMEQIIVSILDILQSKIEDKKLKINVELEKTVTKILADKSIVSATLFALIENAVLYNRVGGLVQIKIQKLTQRPYLEINVEDTGIGMTKKDLANLFKKYYRGEIAKQLDVKGFGIGLYNVKNLLNLYGGEIKVESQENKGTKITILLPLDPNLIPGYKLQSANE